ncbi:MAG: 4Fe-4S dicluster domain-containing protein [Chlorobi bacterium]|nr:4Fe-4S dicluster domain-containing protein [Chlorobiota bacterium]
MKKQNIIDHDKCKKCKLCIEVCPVNMIGIDSNGLTNFIPERESICLECGQCMAVCSTDAIKISKYSYEENFYPLPEKNVDYEKFTDFIASRRSIRNYKNKPVERSIIEQIIESLDYAPYGSEPNKVKITVFNNREKIESALPLIEKFLDDIIHWVDSPIVSRIIKLKKGNETFNTLKNHLYPMSKLENYKLKFGDRITRGAPAILVFHGDKGAEEHTNNAIIYATYAIFTAHSLGLGAAMNGIVPAAINKEPQIREMFKIPKNEEAVISVILGYPKIKYKKAIKREPKITNWVA